MTRRIDYRSDKRRRSVVEQGYESWNGSVIGDGLGKLDRSEYDPRTRATVTPEKTDAKPRERAKASPKNKVKRINPESPEGKKIAEEALRAVPGRPHVQSYSQNSTKPIQPASSGPSLAPLTTPRTPRPSSSGHPRADAHFTVPAHTANPTSVSVPQGNERPKSRRWLLWSIPVLLAIAMIWASR
jgi:hypothetical protein